MGVGFPAPNIFSRYENFILYISQRNNGDTGGTRFPNLLRIHNYLCFISTWYLKHFLRSDRIDTNLIYGTVYQLAR